MKRWLPIDATIARSNQGFTHGGITKRELSSERAFKALSISITTSTERLRVLALTLPFVKYSQGFFEKSIPPKLLTVKPVHDGHSLQFES